MLFGEYLVTYSNGKITQNDINQALAIQKDLDGGKRLGSILVEMCIIKLDELLQLLLDYHRHEQLFFFRELKKERIDKDTHHPHVSETAQYNIYPMKFGEFLVFHSKGRVTEEHINIALNLQSNMCMNIKIGRILVNMGILSREEMGMFLVSYNKYKMTLFIQSIRMEDLIDEYSKSVN